MSAEFDFKKKAVDIETAAKKLLNEPRESCEAGRILFEEIRELKRYPEQYDAVKKQLWWDSLKFWNGKPSVKLDTDPKTNQNIIAIDSATFASDKYDEGKIDSSGNMSKFTKSDRFEIKITPTTQQHEALVWTEQNFNRLDVDHDSFITRKDISTATAKLTPEESAILAPLNLFWNIGTIGHPIKTDSTLTFEQPSSTLIGVGLAVSDDITYGISKEDLQMALQKVKQKEGWEKGVNCQ